MASALMDSFQGVLFDYDGTLVQSMQDNFLAWKRALRTYGVEIGEEDYFPFEGIAIENLVDNFKRKRPDLDIPAYELIQKKEALFCEIHRFFVYPGVEESLCWLKENHIPRGVVTSARMDRLKRTAPKEFLEQFDAIISGEFSQRGKPFPDPYLVGAQSLGLRPEHCVVIENAPLGIQSAKSAGCYCVALGATVDKKHLIHSDLMFSSMWEFFQSGILQKLFGKNVKESL